MIEQNMDDALPPRLPQEEFARRPPRNPVFNLPPALVATLGLLFAIFLVQNLLLPPAALDWFYFTFGFIPARYITSLSRQGLEWLWTPVTYSLLHGGVERPSSGGSVPHDMWCSGFCRRLPPLFSMQHCIGAH